MCYMMLQAMRIQKLMKLPCIFYVPAWIVQFSDLCMISSLCQISAQTPCFITIIEAFSMPAILISTLSPSSSHLCYILL